MGSYQMRAWRERKEEGRRRDSGRSSRVPTIIRAIVVFDICCLGEYLLFLPYSSVFYVDVGMMGLVPDDSDTCNAAVTANYWIRASQFR